MLITVDCEGFDLKEIKNYQNKNVSYCFVLFFCFFFPNQN